MSDGVVVGGVGIHPFGRFEAICRELGLVAAREALEDATISYGDVDVTCVANVGEDMAKGQSMLGLAGATGRPIYNVEAACGSSGAALKLAAAAIGAEQANIVLCAGVEKAPRVFIARSGYGPWQLRVGLGVNPVYFALEALRVMRQSDVTEDDLAAVSEKNDANAVHNPNAMYRKPVTRQEVPGSKMVCWPLRLLMLRALNEGAAAAVLMSEHAAARHAVRNAVRLRGVSLVSRTPSSWFITAASHLPEASSDLTRRAAAEALAEAGVGPEEMDVVECQDTDAASELRAYRGLGRCAPEDEGRLLRSGTTRLDGRLPVNTSGGLLSKGEPLGASGLGEVHEIVTQLRGRGRARQVDGPRLGLTHVQGAGQTASVAMLSAA